MKPFAIAAVATTLAAPASAAVIGYQGLNYTSFDWTENSGYCVSSCGMTTGPYDASMSMNFLFEIDGDLQANTKYDDIGTGDAQIARLIDWSNGLMQLSDVIPGILDQIYYSFVTDAFGRIATWDIKVDYGYARSFDYLVTRSTNDGGDESDYEWQYMSTCDDPGTTECFGGDANLSIAWERASASVGATGTWSVDGDLPAVPLPAGGVLYGSALFAAAAIWRRRRKG